MCQAHLEYMALRAAHWLDVAVRCRRPNPIGVDHDPTDEGVAAEAVDGVVGQVGAVFGLADRVVVWPSGEGFVVDDNDDVGSALGAVSVLNEFDEGVGAEGSALGDRIANSPGR